MTEQRSDKFTGFVARRFGGGNAIGDREGDQRSWICERAFQSDDRQRVDLSVRPCRANCERTGGFGANIRIGVADESDQRCRVLGSAEAGEEPGGIAALLSGAGEQRGETVRNGLLAEGANRAGEDHAGAAEGPAKHSAELVVDGERDLGKARDEVAQGRPDRFRKLVGMGRKDQARLPLVLASDPVVGEVAKEHAPGRFIRKPTAKDGERPRRVAHPECERVSFCLGDDSLERLRVPGVQLADDLRVQPPHMTQGTERVHVTVSDSGEQKRSGRLVILGKQSEHDGS